LRKIPATLFTFIISLLLAATCAAYSHSPLYAVSVSPTPVLNTPDFAAVFGGRDGKTLRLDRCGQIREMEFVALAGTLFRIEESLHQGNTVIYRVTTDDYPYPTTKGYFVDSRFVRTTDDSPPPRPRSLPPKEKVISNLLAAQGSRYVWGGNYRAGIPQLLEFYPPAPGNLLPAATLEMWKLRGVDCSGLLYEATGGFTPRNTSALVNYGVPVPIAGLDTDRIIQLLKPLDLFVWSGHVMIVIDGKRIIESRMDCHGKKDGVMVRPLREVLIEIRKKRVPLDDYATAAAKGVKGFVIRRWYPGGSS
jgi:cell wall-associated NlpC family hydrolase